MPAEPENDGNGAEDEKNNHGGEQRPRAHPLDGRHESLFHPETETTAIDTLVPKGLDRANGRQGLIHIGPDVSHPVLAFPAQAPDFAAIDKDRQQDEWHDEEHQAGQLGRGDDQEHRAADQQQGVAQSDGDRRADHHLQQGRVGGQGGRESHRSGSPRNRPARARFTRSYTAPRISATTRSPIQETRKNRA